MFCLFCGEIVEDLFQFCPFCGSVRWPIRAIHKTIVQCKYIYFDTLLELKFVSMQNKFVLNAKQICSQCKTKLIGMRNKFEPNAKSI